MNKKERQNQIKRLIQSTPVSTQEAIKQHLETQGISVTQATLSRDLREIGLLKLRNESGKLYYSLADTGSSVFSSEIRSYIRHVSRAEFMLVCHTNLGEADVLANLIDDERRPEILGTVAGADTLLVICRDKMAASQFDTDLLANL